MAPYAEALQEGRSGSPSSSIATPSLHDSRAASGELLMAAGSELLAGEAWCSSLDWLLPLQCPAQNYAWGRLLHNSEVAQLAAAAGQSVDPAKPYAELWMGTHPSAPAMLAPGAGPYAGQPLLALLRDHPELLGAAAPTFGADLPFLFKVLSVETALSIQSHPDKALAERLHAERPEVYKDDNHKPEMAVALSDFEALCSFCGHEELAVALGGGVPELRALCGARAVDAYLDAPPAGRAGPLRAAFTALMTAPAAPVAAATRAMCARLEVAAAAGVRLSPKEALVLRLQAQYPDDVGVMAAWFLNHLRLAPGQAIALPANEPHAYISGEIVEVMATSDNVVRAGLTPKFRDTEVLCSSLTYGQGPPAVLTGCCAGAAPPALACYRPRFREFELWRLTPGPGASHSLPPAPGPMVMLVQRGAGHAALGSSSSAASDSTSSSVRAAAGDDASDSTSGEAIKRGDVFFVPAGLPLEVTAVGEGLTVWFAACNGMGFRH
eukprot:scaffold12.g8092.t1